MRIVVTGGSGFLGQPLMRVLRGAGHEVIQLVRREPTGPDQRRWDPAAPLALPDGTDAVINLGGVWIGEHRWNDEFRKEILTSRTIPTTTVARAVAAQRVPVLLSASGIDYYGSGGDQRLIEADGPGDGFMAGVCRTWEAATRPASEAGARVVLLRSGFPLHRSGGFLKPQMLPFKLGIGGKFGDGRQWIPWIGMTDWLAAAEFLLTADIDGPVNMVGPDPVTNAHFTKALGAALHRPTIMPVPHFALRVLLGELGDAAFRSFRALPGVLQAAGFEFQYRTVEQALHAAMHDPMP